MSSPSRPLRIGATVLAAAVSLATSVPTSRYEARRTLFDEQGLRVHVHGIHVMGQEERVSAVDIHFTVVNARGDAVTFSTESATFEGTANATPATVKLAAGEAKALCVRFEMIAEPPPVARARLGVADLPDGRAVAIEVQLER